jgi:putative ABC transport system permease protein
VPDGIELASQTLVNMLTTIGHQLRLAYRALSRERGVTAVAVASLALGISANATVFSLVQAIEFPSLIYPQASRIVFLESRNDVRNLVGMPISAPDGADIAAAAGTLERVGFTADQASILHEGGARRVGGRRVTPEFFAVMGIAPSLGRVLAKDDGQNALVLSDRLWRSAFGADAAIVGRAIHLDGGQVTVIGVMPPRFDEDADIWVRLVPAPETFRRDDRQFTVFARLAPRASIGAATREIADISRRLAADHPATNRDWTMFPIELTRLHGRDSRGVFLLLQAAVGFVLVIACANIANILLARGTRRRHEMAVRLSLGASRARLVGELLTESVLLALAGGACGVTLAMWGIRLARAIGGFPDVLQPTLNPFVLGFTAALSMLTGILCGIVPALRASAVAPDTVLRADGGRGTAGASRGRLRAGLVAVQVASAVVLATCGALMLQTFLNRQRIDLGFDPRGAVRASVVLTGERYRDPRALAAAVDSIVDTLRQRPDVAAAGVSTFALPTPPGGQRTFTLPAEHDTALNSAVRRGVEAVSPEYFEAYGAALKAGRAFTPADRGRSAPVAIVNEELARYLWPSGNAVGQLLRLGAPGEQAPVVTVVGVVATIRRSAMHDFVVARAYVPYAQYPNASLTLVARGRGAAVATTRALQDGVRETDPSLLVEQLRTVDDDLAQFVAPIRLITILLAGFGLAGLLLAALGVFGTMSYTVSQRQRELAVRSALGADRRDIVRLVLWSALRITAIGVAAGLAVAFAATRALASFLYGVTPTDPLTFAAVAGFLVIVSLAACQRPARMAAGIDPMSILRQ